MIRRAVVENRVGPHEADVQGNMALAPVIDNIDGIFDRFGRHLCATVQLKQGAIGQLHVRRAGAVPGVSAQLLQR